MISPSPSSPMRSAIRLLGRRRLNSTLQHHPVDCPSFESLASLRTMSSAKARLENIKDSINPPMSQSINNEIKGRLALVTGASGGFVS